jgi:hypothetical protein
MKIFTLRSVFVRIGEAVNPMSSPHGVETKNFVFVFSQISQKFFFTFLKKAYKNFAKIFVLVKVFVNIFNRNTDLDPGAN